MEGTVPLWRDNDTRLAPPLGICPFLRVQNASNGMFPGSPSIAQQKTVALNRQNTVESFSAKIRVIWVLFSKVPGFL
eukprot:scaffold1143_cov177-Amphora_coffeaeformis.AAC.27